ncbi:GNAT family N-acetyltransferase [Streptomyces sp. CC228A]|uniref:GNAT family N-acetyltransferase n=1 Tax=Streptomyces sp. CC228A TaxID=2898186 RepID=UPI0035A8E3E1
MAFIMGKSRLRLGCATTPAARRHGPPGRRRAAPPEEAQTPCGAPSVGQGSPHAGQRPAAEHRLPHRLRPPGGGAHRRPPRCLRRHLPRHAAHRPRPGRRRSGGGAARRPPGTARPGLARRPPGRRRRCRPGPRRAPRGPSARRSRGALPRLADTRGDAAAWADLYLDPAAGVAQIEDLVTDRAHRRRGHAAAVLGTALRQAADAGSTTRFLTADAADRPAPLVRAPGLHDRRAAARLLPLPNGPESHSGVRLRAPLRAAEGTVRAPSATSRGYGAPACRGRAAGPYSPPPHPL